MKKMLFCLVAIMMLFTAFACTNGAKEDPVVIPDDYERADILEANPFKLEGIGTQFDAHFWSPDNASLTEEDWAIWMERLEMMRMDTARIKILPDWYEISNDNDASEVTDFSGMSWDNVYMNALYRVLDACEEYDISVDLSFYGLSHNNSTNWLGYHPCTNWVSAPTDLDEFAETVYAALKYLTDVKKYTCITEFSIYPEPELNFLNTSDYFDIERFYDCIRKVDARLKKEGIRDRFIFSGFAEVAKIGTLENALENVADCLDKFTGSWYKFNNEHTNFEIRNGVEPFVYRTAPYNKPYGTSEFGSNLPKAPLSAQDIDTYERALYVTRFATLALGEGFSNIKMWVLGDVYYDSTLNEFGLWKYKTENWAPRPQFFTYSLLTRYTEKESTIHKSSLIDDHVSVISFCNPEGKWTYVMINNDTKERNIAVVNSFKKNLELDKYEVTEESLPSEAVMVECSRTYTVNNGAVSLTMKPKSFVVLTELD